MWAFAENLRDPVFLFAAACVGLYAWDRFHIPKPVRSTTTRGRYVVALGGYMFVELTLFFVLAWVLQENPYLSHALRSFIASELRTVGETDVTKGLDLLAPSNAARTSAPGKSAAIAALVLTVVFPKIPLLNRPYGMIKKWFRELGLIPGHALTVRHMLRKAQFDLPADLEAAVRKELSEQEIKADAFLHAPAKSAEAIWIQVVALMIKVREVAEYTPHFCTEQEELFGTINEFYENEKAMARVVFVNPQDNIRYVFHDRWSKLLGRIYEVIAHGLLQTTPSMGSLQRTLEGWGFSDLMKEKSPLTFNDYVGVVLILFFCFFFYFMVAIDPERSVEERLIMAITIAITIVASIASAIYPKKFFAPPELRGLAGRPWSVYLMSGVLAAVCWFVIHGVRVVLEGAGDVTDILHRVAEPRPWVLMSIVTAFTIAFLCDTPADAYPIGKDKRRWRARWFEGGIMASVYALAGSAVIHWFTSSPLPNDASPKLREFVDMATAQPERIIGFVIFIGFIVGVMVPSLYRHARNRAQLAAEAAAPSGQGARASTTKGPPLPQGEATKRSAEDDESRAA